jgi:hypothetical protein
MPVKVNSARLKRGSAVFGEAFADPDDDWLEGLAINIENTSTKPIVHIDVSLTFFKKKKASFRREFLSHFPSSTVPALARSMPAVRSSR